LTDFHVNNTPKTFILLVYIKKLTQLCCIQPIRMDTYNCFFTNSIKNQV